MVTPVRIQQFEPPERIDEDLAYASIREFITIPVDESFALLEMALPPNEFALGSLRDGRLRVVEPIKAVRTTDEGKCVVEAPELNEFGFGDNLSEAITDLQAAIVELFFTLETEQARLGQDLAMVWATLSQKVRKVHATYRS